MESCGFEEATPIAEAAALLLDTFESASVSEAADAADAADAGSEVPAEEIDGSEGEAVSLGDVEESGVVA